jgi:hypothetical protein
MRSSKSVTNPLGKERDELEECSWRSLEAASLSLPFAERSQYPGQR